MLALMHTPRGQRVPLSAFPHVIQPSRKSRTRTTAKPAPIPQIPSEARLFLVYWKGENGHFGNSEIWISDGKLTSQAIAAIRAEVNVINGWPKRKPVIIANLMELEGGDS